MSKEGSWATQAVVLEIIVKFTFLCILGVAGLSAVSPADDNGKIEHPWLVRARILQLQPANQSGAFTALSTNFAANAISLNTKTFPEFDVSYFFNKNIAAELVLTYPQQQDVNLAGVGSVGTVTHLPPTLTLQYHYPIDKCPVTPYVGAGFNYTRITSQNLSVSTTALEVNKDSVGFAYGAGFDYELTKRWSLNFDFKHVDIATNLKVSSSSALLTNLNINPNLFSIGVGYRF